MKQERAGFLRTLEILDAINPIKNCKSPTEDNIRAELINKVSTLFIEGVNYLITLIWNNESSPDDWNTAIIIPILKKAIKQAFKTIVEFPFSTQPTIDHAERELPKYNVLKPDGQR